MNRLHLTPTGQAINGHICNDTSMKTAILRWLTLPTPSWPHDLPWDCMQCGGRQAGNALWLLQAAEQV